MPVCCCIKYCKNTKRQKDSKIIYRRFPFKRFKEIIKYWIAATERDNWILYSDALICSMHFVHDDYYDINSSKKRYLKPNAMPTQNPHGTKTSNGCPLDVYHGDSKPPLDVHETSRKHLLDIHSSAFHTSIRHPLDVFIDVICTLYGVITDIE